MKVTVETVLAPAAVASFYDLYLEAFDPMRTLAAARHVLSAGEFADEMADPRIDKYVTWDEDGTPVALTTLVTDLSAVPWISPEFLTTRYPRRAAGGTLYYLGYALAGPRGRRGYARTAAMLGERMAAEGAVLGWDICAYNDGRRFGAGLLRLIGRSGGSVERVDVQTYYAIEFAGAGA